MKCKNCGAGLLDTDRFCNQCGWKVEEKMKCPECGEILREGARFCPECGRMLGEGDLADGAVYVKDAETDDMPIADIEQNIVSMTEREMRISDKERKAAAAAKVHREENTAHRSADKEHKPVRQSQTVADRRPSGGTQTAAPTRRQTRADQESEYEMRRAKKPVPASESRKRSNPPPVKKKAYREWEDDDWDEDDDDEEEGGNIMMIVSVCMAFLILAVAAFLIFSLIRKQPIKDYGKHAQDTENAADTGEGTTGEENPPNEDIQGGADGGIEISETANPQTIGTLEIVSNVNVRDNPTTEGSNVIKVAKAGETYEYSGTTEDGNWYIIVLEDGSTGYVFEQYISVQ